MNHRFPWMLVRAVLGLSVLLSGAACVDRPEGEDIDGQDVEVVFLHSSDIHSRLVPYELDVGATDQTLGLLPTNAPFGGMARLSSVAQQERRNNARFVYVDTGDVFQGAPIFNAFGGEPEFRALTQMGVDVFAIGNHEFDNGATLFVQKAQQFANFPMLAANYLFDDPNRTGNALTGQIGQPFSIVNVRGLRVGIIGLGDLGAMRSIFKGGNTLGITPLRTKEVLQQYVDFLRPQVDLIVVASHAGYQDDLQYIPRVEGIDIVFGGHLHIVLDPPNVVQDCDVAKLKRERDRYVCDTPDKLRPQQAACEARKGCGDLKGGDHDQCVADCKKEAEDGCAQEEASGRYAQKRAELDEDIRHLEARGCHPRDVLLVHSGAFLKFVGKLSVTVRQCTRLVDQKEVCVEEDAGGNCVRKVPRRCVGRSDGRNDWEVIAHRYELIPVDKTLPDDPQMLLLLEPYLLEFSRMGLLTQVVGFSSSRLKRFSSGSGDSQVGNMVADAMQVRNQVWADFAVTNSLGIRSDIVPGPVNEEQFTNVFPFENSLTVMYLSGYEVQELMDFVTQRSTNRGCQSQAQVAGLTATLNCGGCPEDGGNKCTRAPYNGEACAQKVTIGGSGRACLRDEDCAKDESGALTGEICSGQRHPNPPQAMPGARRCWQPISCTRSYRLSTNDYIARGGSGFKVLERNTTKQFLGISLREAAKDYILSMPACAAVPYPPPNPGEPVPPAQSVLSEEQLDELRDMEQSALFGDAAGATAAFRTLRDGLAARQKSEADANVRAGLTKYLACIDDNCPPTDPTKCIGLAARQVKACSDYRVTDVPKCEALGRVRAALRCFTLPCINAVEDGRQQRIFGDSTGSPAPDEPWPE